MEPNGEGARRLSEFGQTWVRQMEHGSGQAPAIGWCLWAAIAAVTVLFALLQAQA
jgi:hypothetical protein